jgi:cytochrome c
MNAASDAQHIFDTSFKEHIMSILSRHTLPVLFALSLVGAGPAAAAEGGATKPEAEAMVKKGVAYMRANGLDKAYAEFNKKDGAFTDRDLYLVVYGLDGVVRAHGGNAKMIGKDLLELKDIDGKAFVKERVELGKAKASFWQEYKFVNPETKKIEPKLMYCEREGDAVVCGGIYL